MFLISNFESPYQVHSSLHFIKNSVHYIRSLSTGETRGNPACACCFIAIFIDTYILKTILEKEGHCLFQNDGRNATISEIFRVKISKASMVLRFIPRFIVHLSLSLCMLRQFAKHSISTSSNRVLGLCYSQHLLLPKYPQPFIHSKLLFRQCSLNLSYFGDVSYLNVRMPSRTFHDFRITPLDLILGIPESPSHPHVPGDIPQSIKTQRGLGNLTILL